ncbi:Proteolipid membrane potential modulator protein [Dioscorea alata]|uniref:Proteolipid membrane potential modulator protein n=1 Tax=Dioscorea alata TaxID=55571 RepID=A0ACB7VP62_DIOAL|nr:Proteolipid membrane potential modulator protein [Dioscorea alata]
MCWECLCYCLTCPFTMCAKMVGCCLSLCKCMSTCCIKTCSVCCKPSAWRQVCACYTCMQLQDGDDSISILQAFKLAYQFPPLLVFKKHKLGIKFWICLFLTLLGYFPGAIYAFYVLHIASSDSE